MANDESKAGKKGIGWLGGVVDSIYRFSVFALYRLALLLAWMVGFYFIFRMFTDFETDTTAISNGAFAIVAALAALSFSCARSLVEEEKVWGKHYSHAGQELFLGAIVFIMASLLKYSLLSIKENAWITTQPHLTSVLDIVLGWSAALLFGLAIGFTSRGLEVALVPLEHELTSLEEWKRKIRNWAENATKDS